MSARNSTKIDRICEHCGKAFTCKAYKLKSGRGRWCSFICKWAAHTTPMEERFWRYVGRKTDQGCILWAGGLDDKGYGTIGSNTYWIKNRKHRKFLAHRVAYALMVGEIPAGLWVLHRCDNPPCINPVHLFLGDKLTNMADRDEKNRNIKGESMWSAKMTEAKVKELRERHEASKTPYPQLAREFGITTATVGKIIRRHLWKHVL